MLPLTIEITDQNGIQWRPAHRNMRFAKSFFGGEDIWLAFVLDRSGDLDYPDVAYGNDVILRNGLAPRFAGEIRQIESDLETVTVKVLGRFVYLDDYGYGGMGKLWCDSRYGRWKFATYDEMGSTDYRPERYQQDNQNRLYIAARKGESFGNAPWVRSGWYYKIPYDNVKRISFDYWTALDVNWVVDLLACAADWTGCATLWSRTASGIGVKDITLGPERPNLIFRLYRNAANADYADETGTTYLRVINLRLWGESGPLSRAIESPSVIQVAEDIVGQIGVPISPISADDERVQESVYVRDTFTDDNGVLLPNHAPDIDKARGGWAVPLGTFWIQANEASEFAALCLGVIDAGVSDGIVTVDAVIPSGGIFTTGLVFRYQNNGNYWMWVIGGDGHAILGYYAAAGWNLVHDLDLGIEDGYTYNLMVKLRGDRIDCYIGGIWRCGTNNSTHETQTKHGIRTDITGPYVGALAFDNFEVFQALPIWPLFYERGESCHKALESLVSYGDWGFRALGWGIEPGGSRLYLKRADRDRVRYMIPPHHASRLSAKGQTDKDFVTEAWGKYIDEDGVERWTEKYYAHIMPTGIVANTTPPAAGDSSAQTVYGIQRERTINFGREDAILAVEYLRQYLEEHAHPRIKSSFEIFGPVQDRFKGGAWIQPYELEMGYVVQIPYFRAVEVDSVAGSDIRWGVGGESDTTFLLVAMQYDAEKGRAKLIPEGASEDLERLMKYSKEFGRGQEKQLMEKWAEASFRR